MTSDANAKHAGGIGPRGAAWLLAIANLVVTAGVLLSPWGSGDGSGVIGHSIIRLLVLLVAQAPIALSAFVAAFLSARQGVGWGSALFMHLVIVAGAVYLYFR